MEPNEQWQPFANHVLVAVPARFEQKYTVGAKRLYMPAGSDNWVKQTENLKLGFGTLTEVDENAHQTKVHTGIVLAIPRVLTDEMDLCPGLGAREEPRLEGVFDRDGHRVKHPNGTPVFRPNGTRTVPRYHTAADIQDPVAVGDTVHFEADYLDDEHEISPGVYRLPYSALVAVVESARDKEARALMWEEHGNFLDEIGASRDNYPKVPAPIAGYVLLFRVWADDVSPETEGSTNMCRKLGNLIIETNVPPLPNEGVVAWLGQPLRGMQAAKDVRVGQRVIINANTALVETIAGVEYLAVRRNNCLAVREPASLFFHKPVFSRRAVTDIGNLGSGIEWAAGLGFAVSKESEPKDFINDEVGQTQWIDKDRLELEIDFRARLADQMLPPSMRRFPDPGPYVPTLESAGLIAAAGFLPLEHPAYNA